MADNRNNLAAAVNAIEGALGPFDHLTGARAAEIVNNNHSKCPKGIGTNRIRPRPHEGRARQLYPLHPLWRSPWGSAMNRHDREDALRLAKWRSIRSAPKDRQIDIWFSEPGIGYRPNAQWSRNEKNWCWDGAAPPDREWCIAQMPNIKPTHWTPCLNLDRADRMNAQTTDMERK